MIFSSNRVHRIFILIFFLILSSSVEASSKKIPQNQAQEVTNSTSKRESSSRGLSLEDEDHFRADKIQNHPASQLTADKLKYLEKSAQLTSLIDAQLLEKHSLLAWKLTVSLLEKSKW